MRGWVKITSKPSQYLCKVVSEMFYWFRVVGDSSVPSHLKTGIYNFFAGWYHDSISHQCHDPDQQTNIDNHPKNGHSEEMGKDRMFDFEREYLATHPDLPADYKKIIKKYHSPSLAPVLKLYLEENGWIIDNHDQNLICSIFKLLLAIGSFVMFWTT